MNGEEIKKLRGKKERKKGEEKNGNSGLIWIQGKQHNETLWSVIIGNRKKRDTSLDYQKKNIKK